MEEDKEKKEEKEPEKELTPMEVLVRAARIMNPRQFELPREMRVPCPFPGTDKGEELAAKIYLHWVKTFQNTVAVLNIKLKWAEKLFSERVPLQYLFCCGFFLLL